MKRLTRKYNWCGQLYESKNYNGDYPEKEIDKLGHYEDIDPRPNYLRKVKKEWLRYKAIEEELGIDSCILYQALKNGYYALDKIDNKVYLFKNPKLSFNGVNWLINSVEDFNNYHKLQNYGKTWALTREELL